MENNTIGFLEKARGLTKNPLGIIALFISLIYGISCYVLGVSLDKLEGAAERLPLIWFIVIFPLIVLFVFTYLVIRHHKKLYAPSDYKDEKNFVNTFIGSKSVSSDLEEVSNKLNSLKFEKNTDRIISSISKISEEIEKIKEKSEIIPINNLWRLNHWGSTCAIIVDEKMIFTGDSAPKGTDGSHIDLNNMLEIGKSYEISCFAKSDNNTNAKFQLWCHDNTGVKPYGVNVKTSYETPSVKGEKVKLIFQADFNKNIRIHLQFTPGQGRIEVSDVRISEIKAQEYS